MSKLLIELGLEESMNDWLDEIQWKRTHDCVAFENAIEECRALARQEVEAAAESERDRCLTIVEECRIARKNSNRTAMEEAREMGMIDAEMFHAHEVWVADELCQLIEKAIME